MVYGDIIIGSLHSSGGGHLCCVLQHQRLSQTEQFVIHVSLKIVLLERYMCMEIFFAFKVCFRYISDNSGGNLHLDTRMKPGVQNDMFLSSSLDKSVVHSQRQGLAVLWFNSTRVFIRL